MAGRPTDFRPEYGELILEQMATGLSLAAAAADLGIHRQRVYDWEAKSAAGTLNSDDGTFADTIKLAKSKRQLFLERRLLAEEAGPRVTSTIFALKNAAGEDWRDKQEHEHSGPGGGPIQTVNKIERVIVRPDTANTDR